ncbi:MAG: PepSY domain-containing protein [Sphingomonadales bacterium]|nr:PepSY domain-containing protein [Sphingomonadales bacterium]
MAMARRLHLGASKVHKWLSLIIGIQLLLWFASGALMSFLPIDKVRGEHLVDRDKVEAIPAASAMIAPDRILSNANGPVESMTWRMLNGKIIAEVTTPNGLTLFDAATGEALPPIDAAQATRIAQNAWKMRSIPVSAATRITRESPEYRAALPAWRVEFGDPDQTSVFVGAESGRITAVRTGTWRLYDFFWSLHIMDWKNHEDFNTPWLLAFAVGGLALAIAGTILLFMRWPFRRRRQAT